MLSFNRANKIGTERVCFSQNCFDSKLIFFFFLPLGLAVLFGRNVVFGCVLVGLADKCCVYLVHFLVGYEASHDVNHTLSDTGLSLLTHFDYLKRKI